MHAAYLQFAPSYLDVDANLQAVASQIQSVEADLIVLPELFTSGYFFQSQEDLAQVAEPIPEGRSTLALRDWAASLDSTLVAGLAEREGDRFYNSAVVVQPTGTVHTYRKVHLFYEENTLFTPGDLGFRVFEVTTRSGRPYRLGVMVCFDWYFPEAARTLALRGADVIAHPSNLVLPHCPDSMPVRARENHLFTITANRHGEEAKEGETLTFIGMSEVCDPSGTILRRAGESTDAVGVVEFDPHEARDRRLNEYNDVLGDRRPETYVFDSETAKAAS
ncbi:MAG: acyltransferase [Bacteroidetes bacterium QH_2_63_10]|nr:MAG: acyltransferase [Bacteroidetes bacterium QH_2_63_10]